MSVLNKYSRPEGHEEIIVGKRNNKNENCIHLSIIHRAVKIFKYIISILKKIDSIDDNQKTILHYIIDANNYEFLDLYLAKKPNIKQTNTSKENLLFYCLKNGKPTFFKVIIIYLENNSIL